MTLPLEITLANILTCLFGFVSVYALIIARRSQLGTTESTKLQEIEILYGERITLLQDKQKLAADRLAEATAETQFFRLHAQQCEEKLQSLEQRLSSVEGRYIGRNHTHDFSRPDSGAEPRAEPRANER